MTHPNLYLALLQLVGAATLCAPDPCPTDLTRALRRAEEVISQIHNHEIVVAGSVFYCLRCDEKWPGDRSYSLARRTFGMEKCSVPFKENVK